jgi:hypothetical protein
MQRRARAKRTTDQLRAPQNIASRNTNAITRKATHPSEIANSHVSRVMRLTLAPGGEVGLIQVKLKARDQSWATDAERGRQLRRPPFYFFDGI